MQHLLNMPGKHSLRSILPLMVAGMAILSGFNGHCADSTEVIKRNIVFGCAGGKELLGVVGFERILSQGKKLYWSASLGVQPFQLSRKFSVPVTLSAFTRGALHHFELDIMATFYMDKYHPYEHRWKEQFNRRLYISSFAGYRLQGRGGLVFKAGVGPQIIIDPPASLSSNLRTLLVPLSGYAMLGFSF